MEIWQAPTTGQQKHVSEVEKARRICLPTVQDSKAVEMILSSLEFCPNTPAPRFCAEPGMGLQ